MFLPSARSFRPSLSLVISVLALVVALGGTSYAAVKINGNQIKKGTVANKALKAKTIKRNKVSNNTLTGKQINESALGQVPSAANADSANPIGSAGGALTGSYPSPQVADDAIGSSQLGTITRRSEAASIAAGATGSVISSCNAGEQVIGGGNDGSFSFRIVAARAQGTTGWRVFVFNSGAGASNLTTHAYCLAP